MVASMLRAQRRDPAKAQAKCAFATNYPLANRQLRSPLILRYRMQREKPFLDFTADFGSFVELGEDVPERPAWTVFKGRVSGQRFHAGAQLFVATHINRGLIYLT